MALLRSVGPFMHLSSMKACPGLCRRTHTKESPMSKWSIFQNQTVVRVAASSTTMIAVAVLVGAGYKWN